MGQILVADSGLVKLVSGTSATSFDAALAIFGICVERHTAALNSSDHLTMERDARYWIYNETLAVDVKSCMPAATTWKTCTRTRRKARCLASS